MNYTIVIQARDGRWVFGPAGTEEALRALPHGKFDSAADATLAAGRADLDAWEERERQREAQET